MTTNTVVDIDGRTWTQHAEDPNRWQTTIRTAAGHDVVIDSSAENLRDEFGAQFTSKG